MPGHDTVRSGQAFCFGQFTISHHNHNGQESFENTHLKYSCGEMTSVTDF